MLFDNVDLASDSGPNRFGRKLWDAFKRNGHTPSTSSGDIQLSFINASVHRSIPIVQRLDGVYFNSKQDWKMMNEPLRATYVSAAAVIAQTDFDKKLIHKYFGHRDDVYVIRNGTDTALIDQIDPAVDDIFKRFENVWVCASSWRPHKRLRENLRYFVQNRGVNDCLIIAGANPDCSWNYTNVFYAGNLRWESLISLCKRAKYFLHLSYLDHCPNVVVDARACGCKLIVSSTGGTREVAGSDATVIEEDAWDYEPTALYEPPTMDFSRMKKNDVSQTSINIDDTAIEYCRVFDHVMGVS